MREVDTSMSLCRSDVTVENSIWTMAICTRGFKSKEVMVKYKCAAIGQELEYHCLNLDYDYLMIY